MNKSLTLILAIVLVQFSCKKVEEPEAPNTAELITSVTLKFSHLSNSSDVKTYAFEDLDGAGGAQPVYDTIYLDSGIYYECVARFYDLSDTSNEINITAEIDQEAEDHLICFEPDPALNITIEALDFDKNKLPINLETLFLGTSKGSGSLKLELKHQPEIKNGSCEVGQTDVSVIFPIVIR